MATTEMVLRVPAERGTFPSRAVTIIPAKLSAANAEPRKPDNVIATWMVARNLAGSLVRRNRRFARLSPWSAILSNFVSFMESTAISAQAKTAFNAITIICNKNNTNILTSFCNNNILSSKKQKTQPMHGFQCTGRVLTSISEKFTPSKVKCFPLACKDLNSPFKIFVP